MEATACRKGAGMELHAKEYVLSLFLGGRTLRCNIIFFHNFDIFLFLLTKS